MSQKLNKKIRMLTCQCLGRERNDIHASPSVRWHNYLLSKGNWVEMRRLKSEFISCLCQTGFEPFAKGAAILSSIVTLEAWWVTPIKGWLDQADQRLTLNHQYSTSLFSTFSKTWLLGLTFWLWALGCGVYSLDVDYSFPSITMHFGQLAPGGSGAFALVT